MSNLTIPRPPITLVPGTKETNTHYLCPCGAKAKDTSKERGRFLRRHPKLCAASRVVEREQNSPVAEGPTT